MKFEIKYSYFLHETDMDQASCSYISIGFNLWSMGDKLPIKRYKNNCPV